MAETLVKICGITSVEDAVACHELGARYLGLVFAPSPRRISLARARRIRSALPDAALVGVFRDAPLSAILRAVDEVALDMVQLHGGEPPAECDLVSRRSGRPVMKALRAGQAAAPDLLERYRGARYLLVDLPRDEPRRTSALAAHWRGAARAVRSGGRVFLAGALDAANVGAAIARARPHGVDVSSGVETAPGVKDLEAVEEFINEVRSWTPDRL